MFQGKSVNESFNRFNFDHCVAPLTKLTPDFSYEFGYINNEDVYDRVFSNFCIGK